MKKENWVAGVLVLMVSCLTLLSCRISTEELARQVQADMLEIWGGEGFHITVTRDLVLVRISDNEYTGLVTILDRGETERLSVTVFFDGRNFIWEITNTEILATAIEVPDLQEAFFVEEELGFMLPVPESWEITSLPGLRHNLLFGPVDNGFAPNIIFEALHNPFTSIYTFAHWTADNIRDTPDTVVLERGTFTTARSGDGMRVKTHKDNLVQIFFIFKINSDVALIITCSAPSQSDIDHVSVFDATVASLEFLAWR